MSCTVKVRHYDVSVQSKRRAAAYDVLSEFPFPPTDSRVLCYLDSDDWSIFKDEHCGFGKANRGVSGPISKPMDWSLWPHYVAGCCYRTCSLMDNDPIFDFVVYLHDSTCIDAVGLTMTLAHELQHFVQYTHARAQWDANERFKEYWTRFEPPGIYNFQFPMEQKARIIAKRISEKLHGPEAVSSYIERNIVAPVDAPDKMDWEFIRDLDTSIEYDLGAQTIAFARSLGIHLERGSEPDAKA